MFGSTSPFGQQSSNSPFGTQSVFGQSSTTNNNPFAPQPFGSTTPSPFGVQTGSSLFGGTSTGVFGNTPSTPFGAPSTPAFGSTTFGASSTSSPFGTPSNTQTSPFGGAAGTSAFGQKPAFGFGSTPAPSSPFGNTAQPSQSAFGSNVFGNTTSSPFGGSQSAFNTNTSSAFGGTSTTAFGATGTPAFGTNTTPGFGVPGNTAFGQGTTAFGTTSTSPFGGTTGSAFGTTPSTPTFGTTPSPTFGNTASPFGATTSSNMFNSGTGFGVSSSTSPFGQSSSAFGTSTSAPAFGASTTPSLGASSPFGSSQFGASSGYGAQSSPFGVQSTTPTVGNTPFGQSNFGGQRGGSRVTPYTGTSDTEGGGTGTNMGKLESISAMPVYKDKSHEELRWEDYQSGDKGGPSPAGVSSFGVPNAQTNPNPAPSFSQPSSNPFNASTTSNPFAQKTPSFTPSSGFNTSPTPFSSSSNPTSLFTPASSSAFGQTSTSAFGQTSSSPFGQTSSTPFGQSSSTPFGQSSPSLFSNTSAAQTFSFPNPTSSSGFFNPTPSNAQTPFGQTATTSFGLNQTNFGGNLFNTSSGLLGSSSANTSNQIGTSQPPSSFPTFQQSQPTQNSPFGFTNAFGQTQTGNTSGFNGAAGILGQSNFLQPSATQVSAAVQQPVPVTNPFGTLPAMPHMSIGRGGTAPSIQYGISSMPVVDKPSTVRVTSVLTPRHLSQRRIRLPARKYNPKNDSPKVPFFSDDEETPSTPKGDVVFQPRENPRALVIRPKEQWPLRASADKASPNRNSSAPVHENGKKSGEALIGRSNAEDKEPGTLQEDGFYKEHTHVKANLKPNGVHDDHSVQKGDSYTTLSGQRAGEAAIAYEHGADIEAQMPKLRRSDYYTEPRIQELAAKERAEPGFCSRVKDFVVGRHGYGSIKFLGNTDVRRLDLDALVQFNSKEVIVYQDDKKKPPVGQGLNKPAEVTLLNIKCIEKKTGLQYTEGPKVEKYKEMLKRKAEEQGAKFVSYDAKKEEWTFMVNHFSAYELRGEEDWEVDATQDY